MTETKAKDIRIDFVFRVESTNETSREFVIFAEPDPRRYDWKEIDGKRHLHDRFEDLYISEEVLFDSLKTLKGKPIHYEPQRIGDVEAYMKSRESFFDRELDGGEPAKDFRDKSEEFLESLTLNKLGFVIVCLDIVGSTRMATNTEPETYARVISSILSEMSEIIPKFNGHVLKYTGDGLIAYFPEPTALTKMDLAIDCAITMHRLVHELINPILVKRGLTTIRVRIGVDAGEAYVKTVGSLETKRQQDIIGTVVNLAAKIQARAPIGTIALGETAVANLHTMWRQACEPLSLDTSWDYRDAQGQPYGIWVLKLR